MAKTRVDIPGEIAARVLFNHDRTCCVCRTPAKPVQIHHIDEDPSNNEVSNLAVLCFECHRETQIRGGFDRKLNSNQVILYRDNWVDIVSQTRASNRASRPNEPPQSVAEATSLAEIYRENKQFELLSMHYHNIPNHDLRDKYIEIALEQNPSDATVIFLRHLQDKPELITDDVIQRELSRYEEHGDWEQRARVFLHVGRSIEAAQDYLRGISLSLEEGKYFSAAFYLKEMSTEGVVDDLFVLALKDAAERDDLWWQVRAMQELGWYSEIDSLLLNNAERIRESDDRLLGELLAKAMGDQSEAMSLSNSIARSSRVYPDGCVVIVDDPESDGAS